MAFFQNIKMLLCIIFLENYLNCLIAETAVKIEWPRCFDWFKWFDQVFRFENQLVTRTSRIIPCHPRSGHLPGMSPAIGSPSKRSPVFKVTRSQKPSKRYFPKGRFPTFPEPMKRPHSIKSNSIWVIPYLQRWSFPRKPWLPCSENNQSVKGNPWWHSSQDWWH